LGHLDNTKRLFDQTAENYDESQAGKFTSKMYKEFLRRLEGKTGKILDVGCGTGNVLLQLAGEGRELYGADISENMVRVAREKLGTNASIAVANVEKLPFDSTFFDILICNASFHHYPSPEKALAEMNRVLKPNGQLVIGEGYAVQPFRMFLNLSK